eukprot:CAMPEP_0116907064 /NCGR_PEP_ID=MMETSP0467-20121206/12885_1 /TAXON_ID=283647 /ORGANISM="Mesodinium pulex, Strain SPMC105" /LENGTH=69 /DNA_ID=CAMNT_0004582015 /DNA_START=361 /DNA_END=570 /DNA_ORIENTATION=+
MTMKEFKLQNKLAVINDFKKHYKENLKFYKEKQLKQKLTFEQIITRRNERKMFKGKSVEEDSEDETLFE